MKNRHVVVKMTEEDCQWLEKAYGKDWIKRLEQHIKHEVMLRRNDGDDKLKTRKPWNY